jgi:hypothetical protein
MNKGGIQNRTGELLKELDELLEKVGPERKALARKKFQYEDSQHKMEDFQAFLVHNMQIDPEFDWENPNPVLDTNGQPHPDSELQYRGMLVNWQIQQNEQFVELLQTRDMNKDAYYAADALVVGLMEEIGVKKAQLSALAALARLADES